MDSNSKEIEIFCGEPEKYIWTDEMKSELREVLSKIFNWEEIENEAPNRVD